MSDECGTNCAEALRDLERYLDGELPEGELADIRAHLSACYPCADRADFDEQLRAIVRRGCSEAAPPSLIVRIRMRLDDVARDGVG